MEEKTLTEQIRRSGVVGCGGAGFPTHKKICGQAETFIMNGAECEPLLRTDRYIMAHHAEELVAAVEAIGACLEAKDLVIALKREYVPQVQALEAAIARRNSPVRLPPETSMYWSTRLRERPCRREGFPWRSGRWWTTRPRCWRSPTPWRESR